MPTATPSRTSQQRLLSEAAFGRAKALMPGGVNSPVRAFKSVGGSPLFIAKGQGAHVWDLDGNRYIDYVGAYGPAILGHAHPKVVARLQEVLQDGFGFGAPSKLENELAQRVIDRVASIEKVRFVNSGTEAVMSAIRLARAVTGKSRIIKFTGNYHGHMDALLIQAGSGSATLGVPDSAGVPASCTNDTLSADYNNLDSVVRCFEKFPNGIAAVIVEPVAGNMGCIPPQPGFLQGLRDITTQYGSLLIFDEVMTGFRLAPGGAQALYEVTPDITTLGKVIGGGMPVGAYGASADIMAHVAPEGPMYQAGTLSGNPMAMAAGIATLDLLDAAAYQKLEASSARLAQGLREICLAANVPAVVNQVGSMLTLFFNSDDYGGPVIDYATAKKGHTDRFNQYFWGMLDGGIYMAPSAYEAAFVSLAHDHNVIDHTLKVAEQVIGGLLTSAAV
jgi:glutamate-1-semialdehyde 2,1-aminomutase